MLYPIKFAPLFKERVWGGRKLEQLYGKALPPGSVVGESWEISDRPGDVSVVTNGPLAGKDLHWLVETYPNELFGSRGSRPERFPLLIKLLDAQEKLSLQVHPPRNRAAELGGEPKTEMWYIAHAAPGAELFVGLKKGVSRAQFETSLERGSVEECFHRVAVRAGDAMFLPSGRVHAIGAGLVIFEIQQNSDTTYRVFDWNRVGLDGRPRALHVRESLASIDFSDFEPRLVDAQAITRGSARVRVLVDDPLFKTESVELVAGSDWVLELRQLQILGVVSGNLSLLSAAGKVALGAGEFCLVPAEITDALVHTDSPVTVLRISLGTQPGP